MKIIRHSSELDELEDEGIRVLIQARIDQIEEEDFFDADIYGGWVIAEPGDSLERLEAETFRPLLAEPPYFEAAQDHGDFVDLVWVLAGDQAVTLIVPKQAGIPTALLDLCARYAAPVEEGLTGRESFS